MSTTCSIPHRFYYESSPATEAYTLSLHDALPISGQPGRRVDLGRDDVGLTRQQQDVVEGEGQGGEGRGETDVIPSERSEEHTSELSHSSISYAVFCSKKKKDRAMQTAAARPPDSI